MERVTFDQIKRANETLKLTPIKGKDYAEVNQRIKGFRMVYPDGFILTSILSNDNDMCVFTASVGYYDDAGMQHVIGTGTAFEEKQSSYINKTSYIENCETSAVGRALGMAGFGIDTAICSADELNNALEAQEAQKKREIKMIDPTYDTEQRAKPEQIEVLREKYTGENLTKLLTANHITRLEDLPALKAGELLSKLAQKEGKK